MNDKFISPKYMIFKGYAGSHSYGTNTAISDVDFRGIFCADEVNIRTPFFPVNEVVDGTEEDTKLYELTHFIKLVVQCNPNIIEMLWLDECDITLDTPAYRMLRDHRSDFLTSKIAFTTSGYAFTQLKRIKGHNKWINKPQAKEPPQQIDHLSLIQWYGDEKMLPSAFNPRLYYRNSRLVPYGTDIYGLYVNTSPVTKPRSSIYDNYGMLNTEFSDDRTTLPNPTAIVKFNAEQYKAKQDTHSNYWSWKKNRNVVRSKLEEQYGMDCKHAAHLVRLLRMGKEALVDEKIVVKRPDAEELLAIRNGAWSYEELIEYAADMDNDIKNNLYNTTNLPKNPDLHKISTLLMDVQDLIWSERNN